MIFANGGELVLLSWLTKSCNESLVVVPYTNDIYANPDTTIDQFTSSTTLAAKTLAFMGSPVSENGSAKIVADTLTWTITTAESVRGYYVKTDYSGQLIASGPILRDVVPGDKLNLTLQFYLGGSY